MVPLGVRRKARKPGEIAFVSWKKPVTAPAGLRAWGAVPLEDWEPGGIDGGDDTVGGPQEATVKTGISVSVVSRNRSRRVDSDRVTAQGARGIEEDKNGLVLGRTLQG
jgi:hypothetical protein